MAVDDATAVDVDDDDEDDGSCDGGDDNDEVDVANCGAENDSLLAALMVSAVRFNSPPLDDSASTGLVDGLGVRGSRIASTAVLKLIGFSVSWRLSHGSENRSVATGGGSNALFSAVHVRLRRSISFCFRLFVFKATSPVSSLAVSLNRSPPCTIKLCPAFTLLLSRYSSSALLKSMQSRRSGSLFSKCTAAVGSVEGGGSCGSRWSFVMTAAPLYICIRLRWLQAKCGGTCGDEGGCLVLVSSVEANSTKRSNPELTRSCQS